MVADGMTNDEIMAEHPDLSPEDIHQALLYAAEAARKDELRPGTPCENPDGGTADQA